MAEKREASEKMVERMRAKTAKQVRPTRSRPLKRTRKKVEKPGRGKG